MVVFKFQIRMNYSITFKFFNNNDEKKSKTVTGSSYPFRTVQGVPYLPLIFMHHMIELKEIPATVLVNFTKLMLHTLFIYRK